MSIDVLVPVLIATVAGLPCSIAVSALQLADSGGLTLEPIRRKFLLFTAPAVLLATGAVLMFGSVQQLRAAVGVMLLVTAATRMSRLREVLARHVRKRLSPLLVGLGVIHGLSNLGGGPLSVVVGSYFTGKAEIRRQIAFAYGMMASLQLAVVMATARPQIHWLVWCTLALLAASCYLALGRRVFGRLNARPYQLSLTGLIAGYALLLVSTP
jgi:hypothetical protein